MHTTLLGRAARVLLASLSLASVTAWADAPRIAVTDLSYEEKVREYFESVEYREKYDHRASERERYRDSDHSSSGSSSSRYSAKGEVEFRAESGYQTYIDRGELRKFTADVKGELLNSGYRVVQGKPWTASNTEKLYDIIGRIKKGYYPGADYVLWGSINNVEFRKDESPIQGSNAVSHTLSLELVAEFSLINTKTYEIKAAFSAMGEGSDMKLVNAPGTRLSLNRSKVMQEVSRSLGAAVAQEVDAQFGGGSRSSRRNDSGRGETIIEERTVIYR